MYKEKNAGNNKAKWMSERQRLSWLVQSGSVVTEDNSVSDWVKNNDKRLF